MSRSHCWLSNQSIYFLFVSHQSSLPFLRYSYLKIWHRKIQGQGHDHGRKWWLHLRPGVQSTISFFISWQSDHFVITYSKLNIWPWKFKVKVKPDDHIWGLDGKSICLLFILWQSDHFWLRWREFHIWPWKRKVKVIPKVEPNGQIWGLDFTTKIHVFAFPLMAIKKFLAEI